MDAPAGRYKIVERNRRLVTVDTLTGQEIGLGGSVSAPPSSNKAMVLPKLAAPQPGPITTVATSVKTGPWQKSTATQASGAKGQQVSGALTIGSFRVRTQPSFDSNGPRTVVLSVFGVLWWAIAHHWRVISILFAVSLLFSWLFFLFPLLLIRGVRQALLIPFRSSLTKLFDDCDQAATG